MYGLRRLNNAYSEHAGSRSDFIIVGHPEYNKGKVFGEVLSPPRLGRSVAPKWDERKPHCHPKRSPAADRLRQTGVGNLWNRVGTVQSSPPPTLKARALSRSQSLGAGPRAGRSDTAVDLGDGLGDLRNSFGDFVRAMALPLPHFEPPGEGLGSGSSNVRAASGTRRHYSGMRTHLEEVQEQLKSNPEHAQRELWETNSWKYYALQLENARRLEARRRTAVTKDRHSSSMGCLSAAH